MYLILPSNSPALSFPQNKSSDFTIPLPITLPTKNWKVGLAQVQLPITFYNVENEEKVVIENTAGDIEVLNLAEGIYENPQDLIKMLERCCKNKLSWRWNVGLEVELLGDINKVRFSKKMSRLLGLPTSLESSRASSKMEEYDPWINHRVLLIHCSLAEPVQFNNSQLQILRAIVPSHFDFGHTCCSSFYPVDFLKVQGDAHTTVSIKITDIDQAPIRFRSGNVVVQLVLEG